MVQKNRVGLLRALAIPAVLLAPAPGQAADDPAQPPVDVSVELRGRVELRDNADFNAAVDDSQSGYLNRLRVGLAARFAPTASAYVQVQDSRRGGDLSQSVTNVTTLHQAYIDLRPSAPGAPALRLGRQELSFGEKRLVSGSNWSNVGRTFDAVRLTFRTQPGTLDLFSGNVVRHNYLAPTAAAQGSFHGAYYSVGGGKKSVRDAYALLKSRGGNLLTLGGRARTPEKPGCVDAMAEVAHQFGREDGRARVATAAIGSAGYTFEHRWSPRVGLEYAFSTGDDNPRDSRVTNFDILYPTNHPFYGIMDYFSWRNLRDFRVSVSAKPAPKATLALDYHDFRLASRYDAWYSSSGGKLLQDTTGAAGTHVGSELDLQAGYALSPRTAISAGYGHFFHGSFVSRLKPQAHDSDWGYVQTTVSY